MTFSQRHPGFGHQEEYYSRWSEEPVWALFWEMGTGKSKSLIDTLARAFDCGHVDRAVIFAKAGEYSNWHYTLLTDHWPLELPATQLLYSSYLVGTKNFKARAERFLRAPKSVMKILIANVEALNGENLQNLLDDFITTKSNTALVVDESTCIKNYDAARSKVMYRYSSRARLKRIATGTPVTESPVDLFGQSLVLGRGLLGSRSFTAFRSEYCCLEDVYLGPSRPTFKRVAGYKNLDKLTDRLNLFSNQVMKADCLDLPDKIYSKRVVDLSRSHRAMYDKLKDELMLEVDGQEVEILRAMSLSSKMHQLAAGQIKVDDKYLWVGSSKLEYLVELLEDFSGKAIVWTPYRATVSAIYSRLTTVFGEGSTAHYYGGTSPDDRVRAVRDMQDESSCLRFLVANQAAAGFGLTLTGSTLSVYYANSYRLELRLQSEDRQHRIGQKRDVTYVDLVARDTVDELVYGALINKKKLSDAIMGRLPSEWL